MATENTGTTAELTKVVYKDGLQEIPFDAGIVGDDFPMTADAKLGQKLQFDVVLSLEHGITYNGTAGSVVTLGDPVVANIKKAEVEAYETIMRTRISDRLMDDAVKAGPQAFDSATRVVLMNLQESAELRKEHSLLYGQLGLGKIDGTPTNNTTSLDVVISAATWCPALWESLEGAVLEAWTAQTASATQHDGDLTISTVNLETRTIRLTAAANAFTNVVDTDWLYFKGARTSTAFNEMAGIMKLSTTTTGTLQGLSVDSYSRFRPNTATSFGVVTFLKVLNAVRKLVARRIRKGTWKMLQPSHAYEKLNSDLMAARRFDGSWKRAKGEAGNETVEFYGQTGTTAFQVHPLLRDGDMEMYGQANGFRTGSRELSFDSNPNDKNDIWTRRQDQNAYEARVRWVMSPALLRPAHVLAVTGVTEATS